MAEDTPAVETNTPIGEGTPVEQINTPVDPGWMSAVKGDLREAHGEDMRQHANINPIIEDYYSTKAKMDEAIFKPGPEASVEELAQYKEKMGIPTDAQGYEFDALPEGMEVNQDFESWFKDIAVKDNYSKEQANNFHNEWYKLQAEAATAQKAEIAETERVLKTELGSSYDEAMANATRIMAMGGEGLVAWLDETGAGNDPRITKVFAKLGSMISEDSIGINKNTQGSPELTFAERIYPNQGK